MEVLRECHNRKVLVFAAAGNDGCECLTVPAAAREVIAVGAMSLAGDSLEFSNWGRVYQENGILAPGKDLLVASPDNQVAVKSGTSLATPIVSGVAGLLLSIQMAQFGAFDPDKVRRAILNTVDRCDPRVDSDCRRILVGRLNMTAALAAIKEGIAPMNHAQQSAEGQSNICSSTTTDTRADQPSQSVVPQETGEKASSGSGTVLPYDCGCGCKSEAGAQLVYAVGKINYDIPLPGTQDSLNAMLSLPANTVGVLDPSAFIHYLLGGSRPIASGKTKAYHGAMADAESVVWTLEQDGSPIYAIQPTRAFAAEGYKQLVALFIEQSFGAWPTVYSFLQSIGAKPDCLYEYFSCYSGEEDHGWPPLPLPPKPAREGSPGGAKDQKGDEKKTEDQTEILKAEAAAFPGQIVGKVRLRSGQVVEVISPVMRGTQNWATETLFSKFFTSGYTPEQQDFFHHLVRRLMEETRNYGRSPEDRTRNFAATNLLDAFSKLSGDANFKKFIGPNSTIADIWVDSISVIRNDRCRTLSECYDFELKLFDGSDILKGKFVVAGTVDVKSVVPALISDLRLKVVRS